MVRAIGITAGLPRMMPRTGQKPLAACAGRVFRATSGHGVRWARVECIKALMADGMPADEVLALAFAGIAFADGLRKWAAPRLEAFAAGAIA